MAQRFFGGPVTDIKVSIDGGISETHQEMMSCWLIFRQNFLFRNNNSRRNEAKAAR